MQDSDTIKIKKISIPHNHAGISVE
jgi:hypothetical protein